MKNLADFQTELARVIAGFVPGMEDWDVRKELPLELFRDFRCIQDLRNRQRELGLTVTGGHLSRCVPGREVLDLLCECPTSADLVEGAYRRIKAWLADWLDALLSDGMGVYDLPSTPLLEGNRDLLRRQVTWAEEALEALGPPEEGFQVRLIRTMQTLGDELSGTGRRTAAPVVETRRIGRLPLLDSVVPNGFRHLPSGPTPPPGTAGYPDRERFFAANFLQEVQAADSCAALLFDAPDLPWEFYFDCSRHMWDESRHSIFGEKKLLALKLVPAEVGLSSTAYRMRQTLSPLDRYAALTTQEADAFPGKHAGLRESLEHDDALGAMTWSYDIADETQHVRYGRKWLPVLIEVMRDPRNLEQVNSDACNWRANVLAKARFPDAVGTVKE